MAFEERKCVVEHGGKQDVFKDEKKFCVAVTQTRMWTGRCTKEGAPELSWRICKPSAGDGVSRTSPERAVVRSPVETAFPSPGWTVEHRSLS